jgi:hypothetical protein
MAVLNGSQVVEDHGASLVNRANGRAVAAWRNVGMGGANSPVLHRV